MGDAAVGAAPAASPVVLLPPTFVACPDLQFTDAFRSLVDGPVERAWDWVSILAPHPVRRFLPGRPSGPRPALVHALASLAHWLLAKANEGRPAAQVLASFLPVLVLCRGVPILAQLRALLADDLEGATTLRVRRSAAPLPADLRWVRSLQDALGGGRLSRVVALLDAGGVPPAHASEVEAREWLPKLFPSGDPSPDGVLPKYEPSPRLSVVELRRWLLRHLLSSPGATGWSPRICLELSALEPGVLSGLAGLWSLRPGQFACRRLESAIWRVADGWLLPGGDKPRPIAAPRMPRRVWTARLARKARAACAGFCEARRQYGLSDGPQQRVYRALPALAVAVGATVVTADRSMSYQTISRTAVREVVSVVQATLPSVVRFGIPWPS